MTDSLTLTQPDDWHLHLRDGAALQSVVAASSAQFARAVIMPNLASPITTVNAAKAYQAQILAAVPATHNFQPLMTLYLTDNTTVAEIEAAAACEQVYAVKYYPAGATTNSDAGVTNLSRCYPVLEAMADLGLPLLIHGEVTDPNIDIFDREAVFIETVLAPLLEKIPDLKVVLEHITTQAAVDFILQGEDRLAATLTVHHLLLNRNHIFQGGIRPDYYCLPILKRASHQTALCAAAISGSTRFFLGTDSAPHAQNKKYTACGCAGIYSAPVAMPLYAQVFEQLGALDKLEAFASFYGADFYGLPRNSGTISLKKQTWCVPERLDFAENSHISPFFAGREINWQMT